MLCDGSGEIVRLKGEIEDLKRHLRQCAVGACDTTGEGVHDQELLRGALNMPLDKISEYVSDAFSELQCDVAQARQDSMIPEGFYYNPDLHGFYKTATGEYCGDTFFKRWVDRAAEFPGNEPSEELFRVNAYGAFQRMPNGRYSCVTVCGSQESAQSRVGDSVLGFGGLVVKGIFTCSLPLPSPQLCDILRKQYEQLSQDELKFVFSELKTRAKGEI